MTALPGQMSSERSHPGIVRAENQDRCVHFDSPFGQVFVTADGMGGVQGGATAAQMVVDGFRHQLLSSSPSLSYTEALQTAAQAVTARVHAIGNSGNPQVAGMGSTVVLALISDKRLIVAHVGDSRAYLQRDGRLTRLTRDHTVVQRMIDSGLISEETARSHPDVGVLSRAIGQEPQVDIEIGAPIELRAGDGILLCSDGLCGYVDDSAIEQTLRQFEIAPEEAVSALIQLALQTGGEDNVTVQYIHMPRRLTAVRPQVAAVSPTEHRNKKRRLLGKKSLVALAIFLAVLILAWRFGGDIGLTKPVQIEPQSPGALDSK